MLSAYKKFWHGYVDFTGRSTRADYWWNILWTVLIYGIVLEIVEGTYTPDIVTKTAFGGSVAFGHPNTLGAALIIFLGLYSLAIILPWLALQVRRLRDAGFHWALIFLLLVVGLGELAVFILCQMPSKVESASFANSD